MTPSSDRDRPIAAKRPRAEDVLDTIAKTKPGTTGKDLIDRLAALYGLTGRELFEEVKQRREEKRRGFDDRAALTRYFNKRIDAEDDAMRAYWAGRIDGHCLQNAIDAADLRMLAASQGFRIDWLTALEVEAGV